MATLTTNTTASSSDWLAQTHWLLRLPVAGVFLYHGIDKLPALEAGAAFMGLPLWLWTLVAVTEVLAGIALIAGGALRTTLGDLSTRAGGAIIAAIMIGAIALVHWGQWSALPSESHPFGGMEFHTVVLFLGAWFIARGNRI
ncbi:DoxX family membrane protein [Rhodobacteraceae bacterium N5(2021)]|uniref:DoxX family membrane protein n=1 Tax=Gymnodinialimonas phycosphaerae TaxID=2841589 RepID=A0A975YFM5_9RHOB|nr:DoxX family membrane protein [Gymnodinialimonas phycosphaerae]MBY4894878.1 DoxX family membrane protein [Gymnodinialimonas phycosphaerae]